MLADSLPMSMINRKGLAWVVNDTLHMPALLSLCYIHRLLDIQWQCKHGQPSVSFKLQFLTRQIVN